jgi:hypothetical protein
MAAGSTYTPIATTTLGSAASSYSFTSIPSTYTDLILVFNGTCSTGLTSFNLTFNSDGANNYSQTRIYGNGSTAYSERQSNVSSMVVGVVSTNRSMNILQIQNYSNTTTNKTVLSRQNIANDPDVSVAAGVGLWRSTAAINTITLTAPPYNFQTGATFTLWGITNA